jgi:hypothetical protein
MPRIVQEQHQYQERFCELAAQHRTTAFFGGLQSGKSVAGADALQDMLYGDDALRLPAQSQGLFPEIWILSKSYTLADQAMAYFRWRAGSVIYTPQECKRLGLKRGDSRTTWLKPNPKADNKPILARVRTAHDPEQLRATGVLLIAWCDEIAHWPELAWLNLQGRGIVTPTRYLITTTPKGKNWLYRDVYLPAKNGTDSQIAIVECRSVDNPWADKAYLEKLRAKFGSDYAAQELDALFTANVGYVYDFDRTLHMRQPPEKDPGWYDGVVAGVDPGYGDPYAVGWWGYETKTRADGRRTWWLLDEFYQQSKATTDDLLPMFRERQNRWKARAYYVDKRRPSDYLLLRKAGLPALPNVEVQFSETDRRTVMPMVRICQTLMQEGRLFFAPHCEWHAEEAENYAFPDREDRNRGENPQDWKNHGMDEMRYAICGVEGLATNRKPQYRPEYVPKPQKRSYRIPSVAEQMQAQEAKWEKQGQERRHV